MERPVAVVGLVLALVLATGVAGVTASVDGDVSSQAVAETLNRTNTSNVLRLPSVNRSVIAEPDLDLSTSLSMQNRETTWRIRAYTVESRFEAANSATQREAILFEAVSQAETAANELREAHRTAIAAYANGSIGEETLLNRLATIQSVSQAVMQFVGTVSSLNEGESAPSIDAVKNRLLRVEAELGMVQSPVRQRITDAITGHGPMTPLFVGVGGSGATLSMVHNQTFLHNTVRLDNFADEPGTSNASEALDRWAQLYPDVWDDGRVDFTGLSGAYRAELPFEGGELISYLDATTLAIYSESQMKTVESLPTGPAVRTTREDLRVTVNRTYPGGPLRVVFETTNGDPLDGVVRVNGRRVGTTGADGVLWTIGPAEQFAITVDYGDRQVALVVTPTSQS